MHKVDNKVHKPNHQLKILQQGLQEILFEVVIQPTIASLSSRKTIILRQVYVEQPRGYVIKGHEDKVYKLKKTLCGIKQAPRAWYSRIDSYLISIGLNGSNNEPPLYKKLNKQGQILVACLYVDDMILIGNLLVDKFKSAMKHEFEITDLGIMRYFLGIEVLQSDFRNFFISVKVCHGCAKEVQDDELQTNTNSHWNKDKAQ